MVRGGRGGNIMNKREKLAKLLYVWVHGATSGNWDKKDFPETIRIAYRKRADEVFQILGMKTGV